MLTGMGKQPQPSQYSEPAEKPSRAGPTGQERNSPLPSLLEGVNSTWDSGSERESQDLFAAGE